MGEIEFNKLKACPRQLLRRERIMGLRLSLIQINLIFLVEHIEFTLPYPLELFLVFISLLPQSGAHFASELPLISIFCLILLFTDNSLLISAVYLSYEP